MFEFVQSQGFSVEQVEELRNVYAKFSAWCIERKDYGKASEFAKYAEDLTYAADMLKPIDIKINWGNAKDYLG